MVLALLWLPRTHKFEADDLTNLEFSKFDSSLRVACDLGKVKWVVLEEVMGWSKDIYDKIVAERAAAAARPKKPFVVKKTWLKAKKTSAAKRRLRATQPW